MYELTASEVDQVAGGLEMSLGNMMAEGALYGGIVGFVGGGPAGALAGAADGALAAMLVYGAAQLRAALDL